MGGGGLGYVPYSLQTTGVLPRPRPHPHGTSQDTLFIFTGDNGANTDTGGSAYPLRGMKATAFEGGSRGVGFVSGAGLAPSVQGSVSQELISLVDWLPTIAGGIAGVNLTAWAQLPKYPVRPGFVGFGLGLAPPPPVSSPSLRALP